jgi:hypothetical protein
VRRTGKIRFSRKLTCLKAEGIDTDAEAAPVPGFGFRRRHQCRTDALAAHRPRDEKHLHFKPAKQRDAPQAPGHGARIAADRDDQQTRFRRPDHLTGRPIEGDEYRFEDAPFAGVGHRERHQSIFSLNGQPKYALTVRWTAAITGMDVLPSAIMRYTSVLRIFATAFVPDWVTSKDCPEVPPPPWW